MQLSYQMRLPYMGGVKEKSEQNYNSKIFTDHVRSTKVMFPRRRWLPHLPQLCMIFFNRILHQSKGWIIFVQLETNNETNLNELISSIIVIRLRGTPIAPHCILPQIKYLSYQQHIASNSAYFWHYNNCAQGLHFIIPLHAEIKVCIMKLTNLLYLCVVFVQLYLEECFQIKQKGKQILVLFWNKFYNMLQKIKAMF